VARETVVRQLAGVIDLAPTLAELAGVDLLAGPARDGVSLAKSIRGGEQALADRTLFAHWGNRISARRGDLLLDEEGRLYDLAVDPNQTTNVAKQRATAAARLATEVDQWRRQVLTANEQPKRPFTVGHRALPTTQLPIRDATSRGNVQRSNRHKNSTYFTNWTATDDEIAWDVEVVTAGRFVATAYYTCPEADVGAQVELRWGQQACQAQVEPGYDPPLQAAQNDRLMRQEGDMKTFQPLELGELTLPAGRGALTLRALQIPGRSVMDIRLLTLTRID
jgi:hypothetical protein